MWFCFLVWVGRGGRKVGSRGGEGCFSGVCGFWRLAAVVCCVCFVGFGVSEDFSFGLSCFVLYFGRLFDI